VQQIAAPAGHQPFARHDHPRARLKPPRCFDFEP
jgi:hypothetical protein